MVQAWTPEFNPTSDEITTTPVWVRISNLPVNFYHKEILMGIAKGLGKPHRADTTTLNLERARFARICFEVNLRKPLKGTVLINGERYFVSYEGLTNICARCGMYGHLVHKCPQGETAPSGNGLVRQTVELVQETGTQEDGFMPSRRSNRRSQAMQTPVVFQASDSGSGQNLGRNLKEIPRIEERENIILLNSFGKLDDEVAQQEIHDLTISSEVDKENRIFSHPKDFGNLRMTEKYGKVRGKEGGKDVGRRHKTGFGSTIGPNGPINKLRQNRPTRGKIFGPSEANLSASGKRLRVERFNVGRPGGVFGKDCDGKDSMDEESSEGLSGTGLPVLELDMDSREPSPFTSAMALQEGLEVATS